MRIAIVGGGIGGLTAAIALARANHEVCLWERMPQFSPVGAGIVLAPNAARLLESLGVDLTGSYQLPAMLIVRANNTLLQKIDTRQKAQQYGPTLALTRFELHEALHRAIPSDVDIRLGVKITSIKQENDGVWLTLGGQSVRFDALIGADGLHSQVRETILGPTPLRYSGVTCWRGICPNPGFDSAVESWGVGARLGLIPLSQNRVYYFLVATAPAQTPSLIWPDGFAKVFGQFTGGLEQILAAIPEAPPLHHDLNELEKPVWGRDRILLMGDAAHAMTPNQGQGAAMAIEDAVVLPRVFEQTSWVSALTQLRHARVSKVQLDSRRIGEVSHWLSPLARMTRDTLISMMPASVGDAQYRAIVEPGLALLSPSHGSA